MPLSRRAPASRVETEAGVSRTDASRFRAVTRISSTTGSSEPGGSSGWAAAPWPPIHVLTSASENTRLIPCIFLSG